ncbi:MAG: peptidylprolyl isomerase [Candidatus Aegiribacteria sp.]|nr:peptidylprolyl isomerase [Candidatus Aegiribacteria sp.]
MIWGIWILAAISVTVTAAVVIVINRRIASVNSIEPLESSSMDDHLVAARVDSSVIYMEDMAIVGIDASILEDWVEDELLASLAVQRGLENVRKSRLLQDRARQIYLRDELLSSVYRGIPFPDSSEVFHFMRSDSLACMVERHYYQILVSDEATADSIHERLSWGENFQITAERLSIGQKAGIGGDLGFMTAGELMMYGVQRGHVLIEGLGDVAYTAYGWHIFFVDEIRPLEDTSRVVRSLADDIYRDRMNTARDSILEIAASSREVYFDPTLRSNTGQFNGDIEITDGRETE